MMTPAEEKINIRAELRSRIRQLTERQRAEASAVICRIFISENVWPGTEVAACYIPMPSEVDTSMIVEHCHREGITVLVPYFEQKEHDYSLCVLERGQRLIVKQYGIREPAAPRYRRPFSSVDTMLVPGLGFDRRGNRLGRGGGVYDRILCQTRARTVGLAFHCQLLDNVPIEAHDRPVQQVITERGIQGRE